MHSQNLFNSLFYLIFEESFGYRRTASGLCLQLLAEICNIQKGLEINIQASSFVSKAKDLLMNSDLTAKQIAFSLSFDCDHYFSRIFKMKTGLTTQQFRMKNRRLVTPIG